MRIYTILLLLYLHHGFSLGDLYLMGSKHINGRNNNGIIFMSSHIFRFYFFKISRRRKKKNRFSSQTGVGQNPAVPNNNYVTFFPTF